MGYIWPDWYPPKIKSHPLKINCHVLASHLWYNLFCIISRVWFSSHVHLIICRTGIYNWGTFRIQFLCPFIDMQCHLWYLKSTLPGHQLTIGPTSLESLLSPPCRQLSFQGNSNYLCAPHEPSHQPLTLDPEFNSVVPTWVSTPISDGLMYCS